MNRGMRLLLFLLIILLSLSGCGKRLEKDSTPAGINYPMEGVPDIGAFSGEKYEDYRCHFAKIKSVTLYTDGTGQSISPTDERVFRLLNFIAYSLSENSYSYMTGLVMEDEISCWYDFPTMLEVEFQETDVKIENRIIFDQRILISGNSYLQVLNPEGYAWVGGQVAERKWPYMSHFRQTDETGSREDQENFETSGVKPWIDLLAYAGLTQQ